MPAVIFFASLDFGKNCYSRTASQGSRKNNFTFRHLIFRSFSAALPGSRTRCNDHAVEPLFQLFSTKSKLLHNQVVNSWPESLDLFIFTCWMDTICKKNDNHILLKVHPYGGACKSEMPHAVSWKIFPGTGIPRSWSIPSKRPGTWVYNTLPPEESPDRFRLEKITPFPLKCSLKRLRTT